MLVAKVTPSRPGWSDANGVLAESPWIVRGRLLPVCRKVVRKPYATEIISQIE